MAPPNSQRSERSGKPVALLWIATSRASLSEHALEREDVEPAAELEGRLALAADADEAVTLVQPQRRLVVRDDARDHRVMIARACVLDQRVEDEATDALAAPAGLHVDGVLRRARVGRLGAIGRQRAEAEDLVAHRGDERRVRIAVDGKPRLLCLRAARLGVGGGGGSDRLEVPDGRDLRVVGLARCTNHDGTRCGAGSPCNRWPSATSTPPSHLRIAGRAVREATRARRAAASRAWASRSFARNSSA